MGSEQQLQQQVEEANETAQPLSIQGGGSKSFYGRELSGKPLHTSIHSGIVDYSPTELVLTAKAGTPLKEIQDLLSENGQMLGFEPPSFTNSATLGGVIATGLAGPIRPFSGSVRDFVLGMKLITGKGEIMRFGGQVIKNVAGFDISRLMVGALGVLGVILEVSLKVIPRPAKQVTIRISQPDANQAILFMNELCSQPYPISAVSWFEENIRIRLAGTKAGVQNAHDMITGEIDPNGEQYWQELKEHQLPFFKTDQPILRVSVPQAAPLFQDEDTKEGQLIDWAGGLRWFRRELLDPHFVESVKSYGGHVTQFRNGDRDEDVFEPLSIELMKIHQNLKNAFDPERILNPGRLYKNL